MTERRYYLVPGFSQTAEAWRPVVDALSDGETRPHALDIPSEASFRQTAHSLAATRSGVWAGYSLGGRLSLQVALDYPSQVDSLLLISANPGIEDEAVRALRRADDEAMADWTETHGVEAFLGRWLAQPLFSHLEHAYLNRLDSAAAIAHQLRVLGQGVQEPLWNRLTNLSMPVAVIAGDRDEKYVAIAHRTVTAIGPNAALHIVPDAGHALLHEQPAVMAGILQAL